MFFPLHDKNNQTVKTVPVISYLIIGLCLLIQLYVIILAIGDQEPGKKNLVEKFFHRHGMVPAVFLKGKPSLAEYRPVAEALRQDSNSDEEAKQSPRPTERSRSSNSLFILLTPLTCLFLHTGWAHLLGNIWFFWIFSDNVEERFGNCFFLLFYLGAGLFSSLFHAFLQPDSLVPLVGASGAISAVMGAYVAFFPKHRITSYFCPAWFFIRRIDVPAILVLGLYLAANMLSLSQSAPGSANIAFDAHIGGFIAGLAIAWSMQLGRKIFS
jgi:membrane associated rhomboid family serine protease